MLKDNKEKKKKTSESARIPKKWMRFGSPYGGLNVQVKLSISFGGACKNILPTNFCLAERKVSGWDGYVRCGELKSSSYVL